MDRSEVVRLFKEKVEQQLKAAGKLHYTELAVLLDRSTAWCVEFGRMVALILPNVEYEKGWLLWKEQKENKA